MADMQANPPAAGRRKGPPWLVIVATILSLLVAGTVVAAFFLVGPFMHDRIVEEAKKRGVEMDFNGANFWWWSASLDGVRFRLIGVPGLEGQAGTIDVSLSNWEPTRIDASDVKVDVVGSSTDLALALGEWTKNHPHAYEIPISAKNLAVTYKASAAEAPWLVVEGGSMVHSSSGVSFGASKATVSGIDVGTVGASWTSQAANVTMGFGTPDPKSAPVTLAVAYAATPPTATITLAPADAAKLAGPLGVPLPVAGVTASGRVDLVFRKGLEQGPVSGTMQARLDGFVPPHPVELDGFLFGNTTTFTTNLEVSADRKIVDLKSSRVRAGAFDLMGGGRIERRDGYSAIGMNLAGYLPCAAVAQSAAAAHVGTMLAELVGTAARHVIDGSVSVRVKITADSRNLGAASVDRTIGVGCGLSPLKDLDPKLLARLPKNLTDMANALPLPDFEHAAEKLPPLPTAFPSALPTGLPTALPTSLELPSAFPFPAPHANGTGGTAGKGPTGAAGKGATKPQPH
jgi:ADP-dependent NAD(P)H-hydrate dehydratase / NAD(P)H-hydrate epimerase